MKRRDFIKQAGIAAAGAFAVPYILPSGRLFAATGARKANHVVFCLYAGGVRNLESVMKADGNLMTAMLNGTETISSNIIGSLDPIPSSPLALPLQNYGTLFPGFRYKEGPTGHFNGHTVALTGAYTTNDIVIKENPKVPTIFEYYRKHNSPQHTALNSWWVANTLGPYPALNYSNAPGYGAAYGANFIAPTAIYTGAGQDTIENILNLSNNERDAMLNMRSFVNQNFNRPYVEGSAGVTNTESEAALINSFISDTFLQYQPNSNPWGIVPKMSNDMLNVFFAEEILKRFKPELLVVNMQDVDVCHFDFTQYANNLRKADYSVAHLWNTIQNTPGLANDTILIVAPEHGRNLNGNNSIDVNGRPAFDHTADVNVMQGDQTAREIFCMVVGPSSVVQQGQVIGDNTNLPIGHSIEIVPAMANILGFDNDIPLSFGLTDWNSNSLKQAFL
ncbi:MAG: hypothetical protein ABI772_07775 [Bacteroidota bacterium]